MISSDVRRRGDSRVPCRRSRWRDREVHAAYFSTDRRELCQRRRPPGVAPDRVVHLRFVRGDPHQGLRGTEFDRSVWHLIRRVPYAGTTSYGDLARQLGDGTSPRDVGAATGRNPLCIIIPRHRVVGNSGRLTGFAGGLGCKSALLDIERDTSAALGRALVSRLF